MDSNKVSSFVFVIIFLLDFSVAGVIAVFDFVFLFLELLELDFLSSIQLVNSNADNKKFIKTDLGLIFTP